MKKHLLLSLSLIAFAGYLSAQTSTQKVLIEEHTGAWCGYCPDGHVILEQILTANPNDVIGVCVHNSDGMDFSTGNTLSSFYVGGFPQATINRQGAAISRSAWSSTTNTILSGGPAPVDVTFDSVLYNPTTRKLTVYMRATFTGDVTGDVRFNGIVVEEGITGTGSNYNQVNYYDGTAGHPMYGLGNPIVGYVHDHVARYYFGGAYGTAGSLPTSISSGESFVKQYTYTVPAGYDETQLWVVGMVSRFDGGGVTQRQILNAGKSTTITQINYNVGIDEEVNIINAVYPNPTDGIVNIAANIDGVQQLTVTNMLGEIVLSKEVNLVAGTPFSIDITEQPAGLYLLRLGNSTERIVKN